MYMSEENMQQHVILNEIIALVYNVKHFYFLNISMRCNIHTYKTCQTTSK